MSFGERITSLFTRHKKTIVALMLMVAMVGFELFNFATTEAALDYFLGGAMMFGVTWAMLIAIPACLVDFAGLSRIFTPQKGKEEPIGVYLTYGGWFVAAILNAGLTWFGVLSIMVTIPGLGNEVVSRDTLLSWVPIGIATFVFLIRVSLIGALNVAGEKWESKATPFKLPSFKFPGKKSAFPPLTRPVPNGGKGVVPLQLELEEEI